MSRIGLALFILGLAAGCGEPGRSRQEHRPGPDLAQGAGVAGRPAQATPPPKVQGGGRTIEVRTADGLSRLRVGGPDNRRKVDLERDRPSFYPVLRHIQEGDRFTREVAYVRVAGDLGVFACRKSKTPSGSIGIDYVMKHQLADYGLDESKLIEMCYENFFKDKIEVKGLGRGDDLMLSLTSAGDLVTALVGHHSTYERFSDMLGTEDLAILIDGPQFLFATAKGSGLETRFHEAVRKSHHKTGAINLDPAVYHWTKEGGLVRVPDPRGDQPEGPGDHEGHEDPAHRSSDGVRGSTKTTDPDNPAS